MVSNAELAKKVEKLESLINKKLESLVDNLASSIKNKLKQNGLDENVSLSESVQVMSDLFDEMKARQDELLASNKALVARNAVLEKKVADLEQYSRMNNIEIKGIPVTEKEDCAVILKTVGEAIGCPVLPSDIDVVHRVPTKSSGKNIIARFCCREKKHEFVRKARKARLSTNQIGFSSENSSPVFVNDHLTFENKKLFAQALARKKEHNWEFLWTDNCQIKARKTGDSKVHRIASESDLRVFL